MIAACLFVDRGQGLTLLNSLAQRVANKANFRPELAFLAWKAVSELQSIESFAKVRFKPEYLTATRLCRLL